MTVISKNWRTEKVLESYEAASNYKSNLLSTDSEDKLLVKIRRCGPGGTRFKVKSWFPPEDKPSAKKSKTKKQKLVTKK
ncbi:MAG: hypothetical protein CML56_08095 [Rhodobacteraceae bacterium]|nr:hypothetical protein [Paracoccaceae bacterium]|tara:strand:- start:392 stop:628 length:237 start_codon:yes stop_codon:yes gene_type:complete